jgi:hypothetical protein
MAGYEPRPDTGNDPEVDLTGERIDALATEYETHEPFDLVEREHIDIVPDMFAEGDFGRRDAEWPVQWYCRRRTLPDTDRRDTEKRFLDNGYEAMVDAIREATAATALEEKMERLTALTGVDVPVASAFLAFANPQEYVAVGAREWGALRMSGALADPYPDPVTSAAYRTYIEAVSAVAERTDRDVWTVYRALWRLGAD